MGTRERGVRLGAHLRWFTVRRAADDNGVELVTRIPGAGERVTRHADMADAEVAAADIYDDYCAAVAAIKS